MSRHTKKLDRSFDIGLVFGIVSVVNFDSVSFCFARKIAAKGLSHAMFAVCFTILVRG